MTLADNGSNVRLQVGDLLELDLDSTAYQWSVMVENPKVLEQVFTQLAETNPAAYLPDIATTLNNLGLLYSTTQRLQEGRRRRVVPVVNATGVVVRETLNAGFVSRIDVVDTTNVYHTVFSGVDPSPVGSKAP